MVNIKKLDIRPKSKKELEAVLEKFNNPREDWMGYRFRKNNRPLYFEIVEKDEHDSNIFIAVLLCEKSIAKLEMIRAINPHLYAEYIKLFRIIYNLQQNLNQDINELIALLRMQLEKEIYNYELQNNPYKLTHNMDILDQIVALFKVEDYDWMGYQITKDNPLTYHHINEESNGGQRTIDNGAPLTTRAHEDLNKTKKVNPRLYIDINFWLKEINNTKEPLTEEMKATMARLKEQLDKCLGKNKKKATTDRTLIKAILIQMKQIFRPTDIDWMAYPISKENYLIVRLIIPVVEGGAMTANNCALLTLKGNDLLNRAQLYDYDLYTDYINLFKTINNSNRPPSKEAIATMKILKKRLNGINHKGAKSISLSKKTRMDNYGK